ncbi:YwqH-like family protein [Streptococcus symci]|uniref:DUF5082 domain-containing protein n=1 Tax=Streptococcus symci TaxID=2588991 RepID=A0A501P8L3_9STRE|nr:DUF5082 family protein [Streptococcus symci]TPD56386.1 DUF5082 domain-containing protein [Streptococcus symci]
MGEYYRQIASYFRQCASSMQVEKAAIDEKIRRLRDASSALAIKIESIQVQSRTLRQILPLDSTQFKGSRQEDFEEKFHSLETELSNFCSGHENNKQTIDDKIQTLTSESSDLQNKINNYYRQARVYDNLDD